MAAFPTRTRRQHRSPAARGGDLKILYWQAPRRFLKNDKHQAKRHKRNADARPSRLGVEFARSFGKGTAPGRERFCFFRLGQEIPDATQMAAFEGLSRVVDLEARTGCEVVRRHASRQVERRVHVQSTSATPATAASTGQLLPKPV